MKPHEGRIPEANSKSDMPDGPPALSPHKLDRLKAMIGRGKMRKGIPRRSRTGPIPLSFAQQRMWFLDQYEPGRAVYNIPFTSRLSGELDAASLQRALTEIVRRHEVLRTRFPLINGEPAQVVDAPADFALPVVELCGLPEARQEAETHRLAAIETAQPFNLQNGPIVRARLLRLATREHALILTFHHIASDAWSRGVFFRELSALYKAFVEGRPSPLAELPIQYADYAIWQRQLLKGQALEQQLGYWRQRLGDDPQALELPTDWPRPPVQDFRGAAQSLLLPAVLSDALKSLSRREGVTLFMTLLAAFQLVLGRLSGQNDILVGTPVAGRNRIETENLIGIFISTLVLRTDLSGNPGFTELLSRVKVVALDAYAHQELPFEKLVEEIQPSRSLSRNPIFDVLINFSNAPQQAALKLPGISTAPLTATAEAESQFALTLYVHDDGRQLALRAVHQTALFSVERIDCFLDQLKHLLEQIVASPKQSIAAYSLVTPATHALLPDPSEPITEPSYGLTTAAIADWVRRAPHNPAVGWGVRHWSYGELWNAAHAIACALRGHGLERGDVVAISGARSFGLIAAMTGTLLSGGVMLTLDRHLPAGRRKLLFGAVDATHVLHVGELRSEDEWMRDLDSTSVIFADGAGQLTGQSFTARGDVLLPELAPDDPAYIFFTSGTTGVPKGILGCHKGLSHFLAWQRETFGIGARDRIAQLTALSFDVLLRDVFLPLTSGASLQIPDESEGLAPDYILPWLAREKITVLHTVPALTQSWLAVVPPGLTLPALRWTFFAGEPLNDTLITRWRETFGEEGGLVNLYGPTETTMAKCFHVVTGNGLPGIQPIGRPLPQTQALVINDQGRLCGVGEAGEIVVRTPFRTLGYLEAGANAGGGFKKNPFRDDDTDRLYYTGDRGRYRPDGALAIEGRLDDQVKINGVRIEPAEVAAVLAQHPGVKACAVIGRKNEQGETVLTAYVVPAGEDRTSGAAMRDYLVERLPIAMLPSAFMTLESLPLTPNGKLDRKALPIPDRTRDDSAIAYVPPRTPAEEMLAAIWAEVLKLDRIGIHDNFFDLGGHSLLATQVIARTRAAFRVELPLRVLFEKPTVERFGAEVAGKLNHDAAQDAALIPRRSAGNIPLSFQQQRLWFLDQLAPMSAAYIIPAVLRMSGALNIPALTASFSEIVRRHEALRTTFVMAGDEPVQTIHDPGDLDLPLIDLSHSDMREAEALRLAAEETNRPFNLRSGPLFRACLFRLDGNTHVLALAVHHIVSDRWSMSIFYRELAALYGAFCHGRPFPLVELAIQYADYAHWQRGRLQNKVLESLVSNWKQRLEGAPQLLELPTDRSRPDVQSDAGATHRFTLSRDLSERLYKLGRDQGVTPFMTLLAAFQILLSRQTSQDDIVVGSPIAGRNRAETETLIGFFVNTLVLRTDLSGNPTFVELLRRVKDVAFDAYEHQDVPFERLLVELNLERSLRYTPLFQVMFVLQNTPETTLDLAKLKLTRIQPDRATAKFDLYLVITESEGELQGRLTYRTELFDAATIARMVGRFCTLLEGISVNPNRRLADLPLLPEAERRQLLVEWNDTAVEHPSVNSVHVLFEEQAMRSPDAVATIFEGRQLSYAELNRRANQLAHYLRSLGVGPEVMVGLCVERSLDMIVALLGILKAGGAYLPLDPAYPKERVGFMLQDAKVRVLLTQRPLVANIPKHTAKLVCLDAEWPQIAQASEANPVSGIAPHNLAYVIYTSGSTGQPKGVMITHRSLLNYTESAADAYGVQAHDRVLQFSTINFDASVEEIYPCLARGATLMLRTDDMLSTPAVFLHTCRDWKVSVLGLPTAYWSELADAIEAQGFELPLALRLVIIGGERAKMENVRDWQRHAGALRLINTYGPTEATVVATRYEIASVVGLQEIPIGRPIANTEAYVLDSHLNPVPIGVAGELHIGGAGLARGYLNRPELTAEKFIANPFGSDDPNARLYKTGDLARFLPDGNIEFLGRLDHQVKIRGFRIEPGEIEAIVRQHPQVKACVVIAREDQANDKRLAAYVVPDKSSSVVPRDLRDFLRQKLPDYMLPSTFVLLDRLPMSANGKLDRKALPVPEESRPELEAAYVAARTPIEKALAEIWCKVLKLERVGIHDNFFELGGHSLLATQVIARVTKAFDADIPLRALFESPTVAGLSGLIVNKQAEALGEDELEKLLAEAQKSHS